MHLTPQDFISTFPWGIHGDKVRILQQQLENELLDTVLAMESPKGNIAHFNLQQPVC